MTEYYTDQNGTIRRTIPRERMSKKERLHKRWEGKEPERFTGRGHINHDELEKVKEYMRAHPEGVTPVVLSKHIGCTQARAARLLDLLSGSVEGNANSTFLVYADEDVDPPVYRIFKDEENL